MTIPARSAALACSVLFAAHAAAQTADPETPPPELDRVRNPPTLTLALGGTHSTRADLKTGDGDLRIYRARAGFKAGFQLAERTTLTLGVGAERSWYDFRNADGLDPGGDPFSRVTDTELLVRLSAPLNDRTNWFALGAIGIAAEDGASISDSLVYTAGAGFVTQASESFSWGIGVIVRTQLEDSALVLPIPQIRWAINDRWTLESIRAGGRLGYAHSDSLTYGVQAEYLSRSFRLKDDGPIPDGMATDRRVPVSFFAQYRAADNISIGANLGAGLASNIKILDSDGHRVSSSDLDASLFFALNARITF
ncbi:MAG: DUF6268 family outer membrane beta-barrel protein [Phycisphaerales bacterium]|nr:hypothetical protein [Planctomycetota bacterium]MCH8509761.1 DUF6268 family outer membrane beta-barrel protein [Phycisphaerales bacterium]